MQATADLANPGTNETALSINLRMDEQMRDELGKSGSLVIVARNCAITNNQTAADANAAMRGAIAFKKRMQELRKGFIAPAKQIIANAEALFDAPISAAEEAEGIYKQRLMDWTAAEERRVAEERRAQEEAARKLRAEAEAKAAAERARAEEQAKEARRKAAEAEEARRKAEAEGNARAAAAAAAQAAKLEEQAKAAREAGEAKAQAAVLAAAAAPAPAPVEAPAKLEGFSTRENWVAELAAGKTEDDVKLAIVQAIAAGGRQDLLPILKLDMVQANKTAKALKAHTNIPGMKAVNNPVAASRK